MKMKKIVCLCLAVIMLCGALVGCRSGTKTEYKDDPNEQVTLTMLIPAAKQKDADEVLAEVNKKLETLLPNTKLEILWESNAAEKWSVWMATNKKIDLAHSGYFADLEEEVMKKTYIALDSLIENYAPALQSNMEKYETAYDTGVVRGELYAVPNVQIYVNDMWCILLGEVFSYTDVEALKTEAWSSDKTTEKFWQIVDAALDKATEAGVETAGLVGLPWYRLAKKGYNFIGGENSNLCYDNSEDVEIIDFYTTEEFKVYCSYMKKWAEKGYVSPDVVAIGNDALGAQPRRLEHINLETGIYTNTSGNSTGVMVDNPDTKVLVCDIGSNGSYWSIPFTAEHPARAIKFLNLLHSEEGAEITNLLAYGIEGKHYAFVNEEKGDIDAFEYDGQGGSTVSYGVANWLISNMYEGMYMVDPYTYDNTKIYAEDYYENRVKTYEKHVLYGFCFDLDGVKAKMSNIIKNNTQIAPNVYLGIVDDGEAQFEELMSKNKVAGIEDVIKELQKQVDEYLTSKK